MQLDAGFLVRELLPDRLRHAIAPLLVRGEFGGERLGRRDPPAKALARRTPTSRDCSRPVELPVVLVILSVLAAFVAPIR